MLKSILTKLKKKKIFCDYRYLQTTSLRMRKTTLWLLLRSQSQRVQDSIRIGRACDILYQATPHTPGSTIFARFFVFQSRRADDAWKTSRMTEPNHIIHATGPCNKQLLKTQTNKNAPMNGLQFPAAQDAHKWMKYTCMLTAITAYKKREFCGQCNAPGVLSKTSGVVFWKSRPAWASQALGATWTRWYTSGKRGTTNTGKLCLCCSAVEGQKNLPDGTVLSFPC